ncbi:MAG TPA: sigma-70 family RNA polymerase sigma factor [Planctomycetota bacterium]|nr:sigma-70 family RNA polymerase sigma factor [Planctomycetota bacterium]
MDDWSLLQAYVTERSEEAFTELVRRHADLVYSTCLRRLGDASQAEDAAQVVFIVLAMKARSIRRGTVLSGWLHNAACFTSCDMRKLKARRRKYEEQAGRIRHVQTDGLSELECAEIKQHLDDALAALPEADRDAVLLRFFENKSLRDVGAALGISEAAAEKRVSRAAARLQSALGSRGVIASVSGIAGVLPACGISAPASLLQSATEVPLAVTKASASVTPGQAAAEHVIRMMHWAQMKAAALLLIATGTLVTTLLLASRTTAEPLAAARVLRLCTARVILVWRSARFA